MTIKLRRFVPLPLLGAVILSGACDTLKARSLAQDGVNRYRDGDIKGAAELFEKAAKLEPDMPIIQINRGYTHMSLYQLSPKSKGGMEAASVAIESFKKYMAMPIKPEQRQKAREYLLQTLADAHKYDEAVEFFKPQVEKDPPEVEALTILGNIAKSMGKTAEARKWLERRIKATPKDSEGYIALAIMDWDDLCNDSQCRMGGPYVPAVPGAPPPPPCTPPQLKPNVLSMAPEARIQMADHGIELLKKAAELAPSAPMPLIYQNLILRERQYGYVLQITDPKDKKCPEEQDRVNKLKTKDLEEATALLKKGMEMQKAAGAASAAPAKSQPSAPEKK